MCWVMRGGGRASIRCVEIGVEYGPFIDLWKEGSAWMVEVEVLCSAATKSGFVHEFMVTDS